MKKPVLRMAKRVTTFQALLAVVFCAAPILLAARDGAEAQRKLAEEQWKEFLAEKMPASLETEHFLLYGTVGTKELDSCAKTAEKVVPLVKKSLRLEKDPAWKGKLVLFLFE